MAPGASSTKTRIETLKSTAHAVGHALRERVPQKQGLKQIHSTTTCPRCKTPGASSTKTRIETMDLHFQASKSTPLRERVPQKQGLKQNSINYEHDPIDLRERVPQKQGLKLIEFCSEIIVPRPPGASSTKTRIETSKPARLATKPPSSGSEFHKNKD